jgi:TPR repeat protein
VLRSAIAYEYGRGVVQDEKEAVRLYTLAAANGHALSQFNLGKNGKRFDTAIMSLPKQLVVCVLQLFANRRAKAGQ